jgi:hypothetical protein
VRDSLRWPSVIVASTIALAALLAADIHGALRVLLALWFMFICTGMAFVPLLRIRPAAFELALGFVLSLILDTLVATALVAAGTLSATSGLITLAVLSGVGCVLQVLLLPPWSGWEALVRSQGRTKRRTAA